MSWRKIPMKFPGTCIVCKKKLEVNEIGLWAKGQGVKHEKCGEVNELKCIICAGPAGCPKCEFSSDCDRNLVSQICICKSCLEKQNSFESYKSSLKKKFPLINI